ncbi:MAG: aldehyde dehydrogenase family protein [Chloroflexi bacterium]|nr:aldehyde dehydrogenase family protein [Chloroflexota bacterium]
METETLSFINPATGVKFGEVKTTSVDDVTKTVDEMRGAFPVWSAKPIRERIRILRKLQAALIDRRDEISSILNQDCGKSRQDGMIELFVSVDMIGQYCAQAPKWLRTKRVSSGLYLFKKGIVEYRPHGVVAVIAPWNYPLILALPPMLAALLAGNTVVLKPSEVTAATGVLIEQLIQSVPELSPFVRVVHGDGRVGAALTHARPDFIYVTGSTPTGRKVLHAAAENLIPVSVELGGKDAMIVLEDADIDAAARWGVWGAFFNAGQSCVSVERVYVVESKYEEFLERALHYAKDFKSGYSTELDCPYSMGPITDPRQVQVIEAHLEDALAKGARLLTGGKTQGMFYDPIVMVDVNHSMTIMREETFGPIIPIMKVRDEEEAIRLANDSSFGLGASIWSKNIRHAKSVADRVQAAAVILNDSMAQFGIPMLPFGGIKDSGYGHSHGQEGLMQFTRPYGYAVGGAPFKLDIATILRENGNYTLAAAILGVVYGTTLKRKWVALSQLFRSKPPTDYHAALQNEKPRPS